MKHGEFTKWKWIPFYPDNIKIGYKVDIGALTVLFGHEGIELGDEVQIGSHCSIYSYNSENNTKGKVIIKEKACIGSHSLILPSVVIEKGEMIPAGSIVFMREMAKMNYKKTEEGQMERVIKYVRG
jgi:acetyltransferase-like isoleucine patch superfamily enzyme